MGVSEETIQQYKSEFQAKKSKMIQLEERKNNLEQQVKEAELELQTLGINNPDDVDMDAYEKEIIQLEQDIKEKLAEIDEILGDIDE